jgi:hypothetical protein
MHRTAKCRAKRIGVPFDITAEYVLQLIGNGICPVLRIPYDLALRQAGDASATLDRFRPNLGYVEGNCAVVSKLANLIKTKATTEQVRQVADWMEKHEVEGDK